MADYPVIFAELSTATAEARTNLEQLLEADGVKMYIPLKTMQKLRQQDIREGVKGYGFWILILRESRRPIGYASIEPRQDVTILKYHITPSYLDEGIELHIWRYISRAARGKIHILSEKELPADFRRYICAIRNEELTEHNKKMYHEYAVYMLKKSSAIEPAKSYLDAAGI